MGERKSYLYISPEDRAISAAKAGDIAHFRTDSLNDTAEKLLAKLQASSHQVYLSQHLNKQEHPMIPWNHGDSIAALLVERGNAEYKFVRGNKFAAVAVGPGSVILARGSVGSDKTFSGLSESTGIEATSLVTETSASEDYAGFLDSLELGARYRRQEREAAALESASMLRHYQEVSQFAGHNILKDIAV